MEYGLRNNQMHGWFRTWYSNGMLCEESYYLEDKEHGIAKQFNDQGELIGTYQMNYGTGVDLWYQEKASWRKNDTIKMVSATATNVGGMGITKPFTVSSTFSKALNMAFIESGTRKVRLGRGFPKYFVKGEKVTLVQYLKACSQDESLPKYLESDNNWRRLPLRDAAKQSRAFTE